VCDHLWSHIVRQSNGRRRNCLVAHAFGAALPEASQSHPRELSHQGIVVIAASLGGMSAIESVLAVAPKELPVPVVVVQHLSERQPSWLVDILAPRLSLPVRWIQHRDPLRAGVVHVAPAGYHVVVDEQRRALLLDGPRINCSRPAADPLFTSAATCYGSGTIAVVLTGRLCDGASGARVVQRAGGVVIAQDPATCRAAGMPQAAIAAGGVHFVLPPAAIGRALVALTMMPGARAMFGWPRAA
jgi:two-component system, chemotaxis family, protein-glutamate methylesterase/glutaminase